MTGTDIPRPQASAANGTMAGRRINDRLAMALIALVIFSAVPRGSVPPVFWLGLTAAAGLLLALHAVLMSRAEPLRRIDPGAVRWILMLALALPLAGAAQVAASVLLPATSNSGVTTPAGSVAPGASLLAVLRTCGYAAAFLLAWSVSTRVGRVRRMAWALFLAAAVFAIWGLVALKLLGDIAPWGEKFAGQGVATGTFVNRNSYAFHLGLALIAGVAVVSEWAHRPRPRKSTGRHWLSERSLELVGLWLLLLVVAMAVLATQSRMGAAAALAGVMLTRAIMVGKHSGSVLAGIGSSLAIGLAGLAVAGLGFGYGLAERAIFAVADSDARTDLYVQVAAMIRDRPLTGIGLDAFGPAYEIVHLPPVSTSLTWDLAHSSYLTLWSEVGLIAGSLPMLAIALAAWELWRRVVRHRSDTTVPAAALGAIVAGAIHSTVDFSLEIPANTLLFVVLIGMGLGDLRHREAEA